MLKNEYLKLLMDIGEIEARLPTVSDINEQLVECIKDYTKKKVCDILIHISSEQNLPRDVLMNYVHTLDFDDITSTISSTKRIRKHVESNERCRAKTSKGEQCTRKRKEKEGHYCGSHINSRPYGEVDNESKPKPSVKTKPVIKTKNQT